MSERKPVSLEEYKQFYIRTSRERYPNGMERELFEKIDEIITRCDQADESAICDWGTCRGWQVVTSRYVEIKKGLGEWPPLGGPEILKVDYDEVWPESKGGV